MSDLNSQTQSKDAARSVVVTLKNNTPTICGSTATRKACRTENGTITRRR